MGAAGDGRDAPTFPDTQEEEKPAPRPPEAAVEGGQVRFDGKAPNLVLVGMAFMTFTPSCKTVELLCEPKEVEFVRIWPSMGVYME